MTAAAPSRTPHRWARHWALGVLLLAAAAVYTSTLGAYGMLMWDEAEYASLARSLTRGEGFVGAGGPEKLRPPLLPLAGASAIALRGAADDRAVGYATIGLALLALLIVYAVAAIAYDTATAVLAAGLLAAAPWFWRSTANFLSEIPLLACFSAALFGCRFGLSRDPRWFYAAWLFAGLALMTRYTALLLAPLFVLLAASDPGAMRQLRNRHAWLAPLLGVLVVAPWFVRQALVFGDPLIGVWRAGSQLQAYMPGVSMPATYYLTALPAMLSAGFAVLLGGAIIWALFDRDRLALDCLLVIVFILGWFSLYRYKEDRLISALLPACAVLSAIFVSRGLLGGRRLPSAAALLLVGLLALFNAPDLRATFAAVRTRGYPSFLDAMAFVRQHSAPQARLLGPNPPQLFWYADRAARSFPDRVGLPAELAGVDWVVIANFERGQPAYVGELAAQLPPDAASDGRVQRFEDSRGNLTILVRPDHLVH
jgi:4-amino-4-deoxy-L-arabinose transferase-like glycosyltransferase